jgi:hypothetical protein
MEHCPGDCWPPKYEPSLEAEMVLTAFLFLFSALLKGFLFLLSSAFLSIKATSSALLIGTLSLFYGIKCCPILEKKIESIKTINLGQLWWHAPVIPAIWEMEVGLRSKTRAKKR